MKDVSCRFRFAKTSFCWDCKNACITQHKANSRKNHFKAGIHLLNIIFMFDRAKGVESKHKIFAQHYILFIVHLRQSVLLLSLFDRILVPVQLATMSCTATRKGCVPNTVYWLHVHSPLNVREAYCLRYGSRFRCLWCWPLLSSVWHSLAAKYLLNWLGVSFQIYRHAEQLIRFWFAWYTFSKWA